MQATNISAWVRGHNGRITIATGLGVAFLLLLTLGHQSGQAAQFYGLRNAALSMQDGHNAYTGGGGFYGVPLPWVLIGFLSWAPRVPADFGYYAWIALSVLAVMGAGMLLAAGLGWMSSRQAVLLLTLSPAAVIGYEAGWMDALLLFLVVGALVLAQDQRYGWSGALAAMAVGINVGLMWPLLVFLPLSLWSDRGSAIRVLWAEIVTISAYAVVPMIWYPNWLSNWAGRSTILAPSARGGVGRLGLSGALMGLRGVWGVGGTGGGLVIALGLGVGLGLMGVVAYFLWRGFAKDSPILDRVLLGSLMPLTVWFLVSPYASTADLLLLAPLALWGINQRRMHRHPRLQPLFLIALLLPAVTLSGSSLVVALVSSMAAGLLLVVSILEIRLCGVPAANVETPIEMVVDSAPVCSQ